MLFLHLQDTRRGVQRPSAAFVSSPGAGAAAFVIAPGPRIKAVSSHRTPWGGSSLCPLLSCTPRAASRFLGRDAGA